MRRIRLHDLRHTAATLMLADGVPVKAVADLLGHDPRVTLATYAHAVPGLGEQELQELIEQYGHLHAIVISDLHTLPPQDAIARLRITKLEAHDLNVRVLHRMFHLNGQADLQAALREVVRAMSGLVGIPEIDKEIFSPASDRLAQAMGKASPLLAKRRQELLEEQDQELRE